MRKFILILIVISLYLCCCHSYKQTTCYPNNDIISDYEGIPKDSLVPYWPQKIFKDTGFISTGLDSIYRNWNSLDLSTINEPLLYNFYLNKEIYRIIEGCHFGKPLLIKIEKINDKIILTKEVFDRLNLLKKSYKLRFEMPLVTGIDDSSLYNENQRKLTINKAGKIDIIKYPEPVARIVSFERKELKISDWVYFNELLEKSHFWEQPIELNDSITGTFDGCSYILEGHRKNRYWFIHRTDRNIKELQDCIKFLLMRLEE